MRNGQNKRMRGRGNRKGQNPLTRVYESNGPDVKIRGTASHVADKYVQLARDAQSSGDPVAAENYYQHAEHYFRLIAAVQEQFRQSQPYFRDGEGGRDASYDEGDDDGADQGMGGEPFAPREQPQPYPPREAQHYQPREARFPPRDRDQSRDREQQRDREPQPYQSRPQVQPSAQPDEPVDVERLPAFVTGGAAATNPPANPVNGQNGFEGAPDRFPLHRRRRRRHAPREGAPAGEGSEGPPRAPGE